MTMPTSVPCAWCGELHSKWNTHGGKSHGFARFCSVKCTRERMYLAGRNNITKAQYEGRKAHIPSQPKGCKTVEEFLAAGGRIYTETSVSA